MSAVHDVIAVKLAEWQALRRELAATERREHPDIIDRYGRIWEWRGGELYTHDGTLAFPVDFVTHPGLRLPKVECADNPNYWRLCSICRQEWPMAQLELFQMNPVRSA
jgi:hypothetical protein